MGDETVHAPLAAPNVADIAAPATKQTDMDSPFNRCVSDPFHGDPSAPWRSSLGVKHLPPRGRTLCNSFAAKELLRRETRRIAGSRHLHDSVFGASCGHGRRTGSLFEYPRLSARFEDARATYDGLADVVLSPGFSCKQRRDPEHLRGCFDRVRAR
jgi:hypothetical protein